MKFDSTIKQMLDGYPDSMPQIDKLREILQQTALFAYRNSTYSLYSIIAIQLIFSVLIKIVL